MKKLYALLWILTLCVGLLVYSIFFVPEQPDSPGSLGHNQNSAPGTHQENSAPGQPAPVSDSQVRVLNPDPAQREIWQQLAAEYSEATGVEVVILEEANQQPTLYTVTDAQGLDSEKCQDLSCTAAFAQLADMDLTLVVDGKYCGIAAEIDCFGLIFNENLLAEMATPEEIVDINSFTALVQGIADKGYTAFAGRGLNDGVAIRLASIPGRIREMAKLWVAHSSKEQGADALERFLKGEAVFYMGSTDEYDNIIAGGIEALGILPVYRDLDSANYRQQSLCVTAKQYWCVSSEASDADLTATLGFLNWLVMQGKDGTVPVDRLELLAPYRQATYYANPLEATLRQDLQAGKGLLVCQSLTEPPVGFVDALMNYSKEPTDENWYKVEETLK